jgi:hypothetical protein
VLPQGHAEVDVERFDVIEYLDSREALPINEDAVILRIVHGALTEIVIDDVMVEGSRAALRSFHKNAAGCVNSLVPEN